jgi:hypothetical protein
MVKEGSTSGGSLSLQNCTLHGGSLTVNNVNNNQSANAFDSAFDGTVITINNPSGVNNFRGYNDAYLSGATKLPIENGDPLDQTSFNWQSGPLGNFYLPANSPLIDTGDQQASAISVTVNTPNIGSQNTLNAFTTQTSQEPDCGTVDIGYHYPANVTYLLPPNAYWTATLTEDPADGDPSHHPTPYNEGTLQAPFGYGYDDLNISPYTISPPIHSFWPSGYADALGQYSEMRLQTTVYIPYNVDLSQIKWYAAVDNYYAVIVNGHFAGGWDSGEYNGGPAQWYEGDPTLFDSTLIHGNNDIVVYIRDYGWIDYFSMIMILGGDCYPVEGTLY